MDSVKSLAKLDVLIKKGIWRYQTPGAVFVKYQDLLAKEGGTAPDGFGNDQFHQDMDNFFEELNGSRTPQSSDFDPKDFYTMTNETTRRVKRFNTEGRQLTLRFTNLDAAHDLAYTVREVLADMIATVLDVR